EPARLHSADPFAYQFVGPGAKLAGRFVRAMKVHHDPILGGLPEQFLVEIDDLFVFVIEKVDLGPDHSKLVELPEELFARVRGSKLSRMFPEPKSDTPLPRVVHEVLDLLVGPARPEPVNDVILEAEFTGPAAGLLHLLERVRAAVQI